MTDEQPFADFVRHRAPTLYRYGYVLTGNHHDADDLVVGLTTAYSYRLADRKTRTLVTGTGFYRPGALRPGSSPQIALSPHWIIWAGPATGDKVTIYRASRQGGTPRTVTSVSTTDLGSSWYATDDAVFWSNVKVKGHVDFQWNVGRLTLSTGRITHPAEFASMRTNGTAWAWRPANPDREGVPNLLRNLVTGESRPVAKATTENMWCTPSFCFGDLPNRTIYVQHLDGTGRLTVAMPSSGTLPFPFLYPNAAGGLFTYGNVIVDPLTGRAGVLPNPESANCFRNDTVSGQPYFGWGSPDQGCDHRTGFAILPYGY